MLTLTDHNPRRSLNLIMVIEVVIVIIIIIIIQKDDGGRVLNTVSSLYFVFVALIQQFMGLYN